MSAFCNHPDVMVRALIAVTIAATMAGTAAAAPVLPPAPAGVQTFTAHGFEFSVVDRPGNAGYEGGLGGINRGRGRVDSTFAIARTEVTVAQWIEFANAYRPFWSGPIGTVNELADGLKVIQAGNTFVPFPGVSPDTPARTTWRMAARYMNWLHNDKVNEAWAFNSGVYDTSTFSANGVLPITDQAAHSPGARYFFPTRDQWVKAVYWDPNRGGLDQPGYWTFPNRSDTPLIVGFPENGGQTDAAIRRLVSGPRQAFLPIASYPTQQTPWGLLGASGGETEFNEDLANNERADSGSSWLVNAVDDFSFTPGGATIPSAVVFFGFRVGAIVPSPGTSAVLLTALAVLVRRRR